MKIRQKQDPNQCLSVNPGQMLCKSNLKTLAIPSPVTNIQIHKSLTV